MPDPAVAALLERLRPALGERISDAAGLRAQFGRSEAYREPSPPDLVARPLDAAEVRRIVALCHELRVPIVPFGREVVVTVNGGGGFTVMIMA